MGQVGTLTPSPRSSTSPVCQAFTVGSKSAVGDRGKEHQAQHAAEDEKADTHATGRRGEQEVHAQHAVDSHAIGQLQEHDRDDHVAGVFGGAVEDDPGVSGDDV